MKQAVRCSKHTHHSVITQHCYRTHTCEHRVDLGKINMLSLNPPESVNETTWRSWSEISPSLTSLHVMIASLVTFLHCWPNKTGEIKCLTTQNDTTQLFFFLSVGSQYTSLLLCGFVSQHHLKCQRLPRKAVNFLQSATILIIKQLIA